MEFITLKLEMATNAMINIFGHTCNFTVLKNTVMELRLDRKHLAYTLINRLNSVYKVIIQELRRCNDDDEILDEICFNYRMLLTYCCDLNFSKLYNKNYIKNLRVDILDYWSELEKGRVIDKNTRDFIKMFDEIHDYALAKPNSIFVKNFNDSDSFYRAVRGRHYNDYDWIIPKEKYARDNRWNPDGKAFLYLTYDKNAENGVKTCFEELRLQENEYATVCKFLINKKKCKVLNLDISQDILDEQDKKMKLYMDNSVKKLFENEKFIEKATKLCKQGKNEQFQKLVKKLTTNPKDRILCENYVAIDLIHNIVEAIFVPVDKENDPELKAYIPFRIFAEYLIEKGYDGIIYKSTRMDMINESGTNVVLFNIESAKPENGTMRVYKRMPKEDRKILNIYNY